MNKKPNVIVIEDKKEELDIIVMYLKKHTQFNIRGFQEVKNAFIEILKENNNTDVVVTDYRMPEWSGRNVIDLVVNYNPNIKIVVHSGWCSDYFENFIKDNVPKYRQVTAVVDKTSDIRALLTAVNTAAQLSLDSKTLEASDILGLMHVATAQDERYPHLKYHSRNVTCLSIRMGKCYGLDQNYLRSLYTSCLLHDIGKIAIPDSIILKNSSLSNEEAEIIKQHPEKAMVILKNHKDKVMKDIILHHHERIDGKGYPFCLKGKEIPTGARIVAVADAYDAQISRRPYRNPKSIDQAIAELEQGKGMQFDAEIVDIFIKEKIYQTQCSLDMPLEDFIAICEEYIKQNGAKHS